MATNFLNNSFWTYFGNGLLGFYIEWKLETDASTVAIADWATQNLVADCTLNLYSGDFSTDPAGKLEST